MNKYFSKYMIIEDKDSETAPMVLVNDWSDRFYLSDKDRKLAQFSRYHTKLKFTIKPWYKFISVLFYNENAELKSFKNNFKNDEIYKMLTTYIDLYQVDWSNGQAKYKLSELGKELFLKFKDTEPSKHELQLMQKRTTERNELVEYIKHLAKNIDIIINNAKVNKVLDEAG